MDKLNTLSALVQLAELAHLPGPSQIRMQAGSGGPILCLTLEGHDAAIAWCKELGCDWHLNETSNEIWDSGRVVWRGWSLMIHSHTAA